MGKAIGGISTVINPAKASVDGMATSVKALSPAFAQFNTDATKTGTALKGVETPLKNTDTGMKNLKTSAEGVATPLGTAATNAGKLGEKLATGKGPLDSFNTSLGTMGTNAKTIPDMSTIANGVGSMGTKGATSARGVGTFSGALGGMATNAGTASTNIGEAGNATAQAGQKGRGAIGTMNSLGGGFNTASLGAAGLGSAALGLFNTLDDVGDAAVGVQTAQNNLDKAQLRVTRGMSNLVDRLGKMNTQANTLGITNLPALNTAFGIWKGLVDSGVTSGNEYDTALKNVQTALANVHSTTSDGAKLIRDYGTALETERVNVAKLEPAVNALDNAHEAQMATYVSLASLGVQAAGAVGAMMPVAKMLAPKLLALKGPIVDIATWLGRGGISAAATGAGTALGIFGAVVVASIAGIIAIGENFLGVRDALDQVGVALGNLHPTVKNFLDDFRQRWMTGYGELRAKVFDPMLNFFGVQLPDAQKNLGKDFKATRNDLISAAVEVQNHLVLQASTFELVGEKAKDGSGKIKILSGALEGAVFPAKHITAATAEISTAQAENEKATRLSADAMDKHAVEAKKSATANQFLSSATKDGQLSQADFNKLQDEAVNKTHGNAAGLADLTSHVNIVTEAIGKNRDVTKQADSIWVHQNGTYQALGGTLKDLGNGYSSINGVIVKNSDILNRQGLSTVGVSKATQDLNDKKKAQAEVFKAALAETEKNADAEAKEDETVNKLIGRFIDFNNVLDLTLEQRKQLGAAFEDTHGAIEKESEKIEIENRMWEESAGATNEATVKKAALAIAAVNVTRSLDDAGQAAVRYAQGLLQGTRGVQSFIDGLVQQKGEQDAWIASIGTLEKHFGQKFPESLDLTVENVKAFAEAAVLGGEKAVEFGMKVQESMTKLGEEGTSALQTLADAMKQHAEKDTDPIKDAWDSISEKIGTSLDEGTKSGLSALAGMNNQAMSIIGEFQTGLTSGFATMKFDQAFESVRGNLAAGLQGLASTVEPIWAPVFQKMATIAQSGSAAAVSKMIEVFKAGGAPDAMLASLNEIPLGAQKPGTDAGTAFINGMNQGFQGIAQAILTITQQGFPLVNTAAAQSGAAVKTAYDQVFADINTSVGTTIPGQFPKVTSASKTSTSSVGSNFKTMGDTGVQQVNRVQAAINALKGKTVPIVVTDNGTAAKVQSRINSIHGKSVTINVGVSGPGVRYMASGFHGVVNSPTLAMMGEKGAERVDVTPLAGGRRRSNEVIEKTVNLGVGGRGSGGTLNATFVTNLDGRQVAAVTKRYMFDGISSRT